MKATDIDFGTRKKFVPNEQIEAAADAWLAKREGNGNVRFIPHTPAQREAWQRRAARATRRGHGYNRAKGVTRGKVDA